MCVVFNILMGSGVLTGLYLDPEDVFALVFLVSPHIGNESLDALLQDVPVLQS